MCARARARERVCVCASARARARVCVCDKPISNTAAKETDQSNLSASQGAEPDLLVQSSKLYKYGLRPRCAYTRASTQNRGTSSKTRAYYEPMAQRKGWTSAAVWSALLLVLLTTCFTAVDSATFVARGEPGQGTTEDRD